MYDEYGAYEASPAEEQSFFDAARSRVSSFLTPLTNNPEVTSQIMDAIYQYGRGRIDVAREKAVGAFLMTSEGRKVQAEGTRQTFQQYLPWIIGALALVFFAGAILRR